jgi:tyrosinase
MAQYTRKNAWNNNGTFDNTDLLWYAKGVGAMQTIQLNQTSSWYFFAAIHGEYVDQQGPTPGYPDWGYLPAPPQVPNSPKPSPKTITQYWDQCQHQSWYFAPWHRGYLLALEAHIRAAVVQAGGPATWALPYWNYFGEGTQYMIPPAFTQATLPDGTLNPLLVRARYGPDSDGNIYIPTATAIKAHPNDPNFGYGVVTQDCLTNTIYTGTNAATPVPGFGGPETAFWHGGGSSGNLESNPHNLVHVYVGGADPKTGNGGLMSDPSLAGLDPIFYLHHANIDRMWAQWNSTVTNTNPTDTAWLQGPASSGGHEFVMPMPDGTAWVYTPAEMDSMAKMNYAYDLELPLPLSVSPLASRLSRLGATALAAKITEGVTLPIPNATELMGASLQGIKLQRTGAVAKITLDTAVQSKVSKSLALAATANTLEAATPDRVYVNLENVRGTFDASVLSVYINLPEGAKPADHPELLAGSVGLFGLRNASLKDGKHGGEGLNFVLEITKIVDELHLNNALGVDSIQVRVVPHQALPDQAQITIGRISIYRQGT